MDDAGVALPLTTVMNHYKIYLLALFLLAALSFAYSQNPTEKSSIQSSAAALAAKHQNDVINKARLAQMMSKVGVRVEQQVSLSATESHWEIRLHWSISTKQAPATRAEEGLQETNIIRIQSRAGTLPKLRSLEVSEDKILIAAVAADSTLRWWSLAPDPRIIRSEGPRSDNSLSGEVLHTTNVDFSVNIPADDEISELRFYHPKWNGQEFDLIVVGQLSLKKP